MPKHYVTRIELLDVEPAIWRQILIPDDMPLYEIGAVLIGAMGWQGYHMFAFEFDGQRYDMKFDGGLDLEDSKDMEGVIARDVFRPGVEAAFQYDFGDDWWHGIKVLEHRATETGDKPPRCTGGENACPPEDTGGPFGFEEMRAAAGDPAHPDHDEMREYLGDFDPHAFDAKKADRNLRKVLKAFRK
ncbi:plasmid pRiA4b ORF-3 family protein [Mesorhizobium xinjiangense]|uniref:plasmid pRiA4b ORF-3 family protein n=1 Tax=Mesorhizobium xinjiangense TaxID=2678685 RepID=UPI0012EE3C96|nr:plasmid pRiA4b ORF-3 family protein [Mesorhizobium xinjiangense]